MRDNKVLSYNIAIGIISALLFIPFLGVVHLFDWDEINFAESAREMITSGDYLTVQINYIPFWEKPPLFIWMQVVSMKIFGINEFAARFPNALCGIVSLLVLFNCGRKLRDTRFGILWVLLYGGSVLPFFYFKSGIIDPWFNLFIFLAIFQIYLYFEKPGNMLKHASASAFFLGLAILTKGPVALLVFMLTTGIFLLVKKFMVKIRLADLLIFVLILGVTGGLWFILQIIQGNYGIIADFITYQIRLFKTQDAGHGGFLLYHFVVLLVGVFPASIFALPALFPSKFAHIKDHNFYILMLILFWTVLILFTIVRTKIVHYSSLCYFPVTFLAAWSLTYDKESFTPVWKKLTGVMIAVFGFGFAALITLLSFTDQFKGYLIRHKWIDDPFAVSNLAADGGWKGYELVAGVVLIVGLILFFRYWAKHNPIAPGILTGTVSAFMFLAMLMVVPRIEAYSQRAAIEFFKSVNDEDAYLQTIGYKSYAHLFYGKVRDHDNEQSQDKEWLLKGILDKPAYFSVKITRKEKFMKDFPTVEFLYEKNGFAFFKRNAAKK